ncbi:DUF2306 domain-containing protein [Tunturibacter empetritectus]|uniref:DUF2306 domain-containing protein n=1 Tax=Tunturiibacter empetritectus TaxID=3069691 RepID=A0A7W8IHR3_9BACT|nr:DUF2306 domain-containing protein [Edaphobacter lichenicola]MBB5316536.1 hypothetical protein [Edaphobacter lichenicola]
MDAKAPARVIEMRGGAGRGVSSGYRAYGYPRWLKVAFWICVVIAVAVVLRRMAVLANPTQGGSSPTAALDAVFASHAALTLAHILPAMAFVLLSPFVLLQRSGAVWAERLFFPLGVWVGVTAYAMSAHPVGGWVERSAVLLFNSFFLFSLGRAFVAARRGEALEKMRWMLRSVAILLGIATTRPVMGVFFATSRLTHLEPGQFFGIAFWIGFSINTIAMELWLRSRGDRLPVAG